MEAIIAPNEVYSMKACRSASLYLAGGITGPDWRGNLQRD